MHHHFHLEYSGDDGDLHEICFKALDADVALGQALKIAPGKWARLRDERGVICELQRLSHDAVWRVAHPVASDS